MSRRVNACVALLSAVVFATAAAATASASGGGSGGSGGGGGGGGSGGSGLSAHVNADMGLAASTHFIGGKIGLVTPGNVTVTGTQTGITIDAIASTMLGGQLVIKGVAPSSDAGQTVQIQRLGHETHWAWAATTQARVRANGSFTAIWTTNHIGRFALQAVLSQATPGPIVMVTVFRPAYATWYNLFGNHTACGKLLTRKTLGVANRTLPCGERVAIYFNGKTIVVPVIDRGPYANGADWDLTEATARAIGMGGLDQIGAVSLPHKP